MVAMMIFVRSRTLEARTPDDDDELGRAGVSPPA
jgi:hypothetical protein